MKDLNVNTANLNCFEKTKVRWGIFSFFSSTNVETKNVCPIAYNGGGIVSWGLDLDNLSTSINLINSRNDE